VTAPPAWLEFRMSRTIPSLERRRRLWRSLGSRRGVAAVLAMMFIIIFGSLAAAMAIASKGNVTTAATHLHVNRAQSAAETGLAVGRARIAEAAARFYVSDSRVDGTYGWNLWTGSLSSLGTVQIMPPTTARLDMGTPSSLADALAQAHSLDQDIVTSVGISTATIGNAPADHAPDTADTYWVFTPAVALEPRAQEQDDPPLAYQVTYAPLANGTDIRIISTGYDFGYSRGGQPITRTVSQVFRLSKAVKNAIISSNRVMVGTNVMITGDIGARYSATGFNNGDPLILRSDFRGKTPGLDAALSALWAALATADVDGDNRLRVNHSVEGPAIPGASDYDGDGQVDSTSDTTDDGYVDEFDIFINMFDRNYDGKVALSNALRAGTPNAGLSAEFINSDGTPIDDDLALLIDSNNPDRNANGVHGFIDADGNGRWDPGELMLDVDTATGRFADQILGYRDGVVDKKDQYAKVAGGLKFSVDASTWSTDRGSLTSKLVGPIAPPEGTDPRTFSATASSLPAVDMSVFVGQTGSLQMCADGPAFNSQVATQLGVTVAELATYSAPRPANQSAPWYRRIDPNTDATSMPANASTAYWEKMPFNSPSYSDIYFRPVYYNMVFRDVQIPLGTNGLFINCTFVGVTWVRSDSSNTHRLWGEYGKLTLTGSPLAPALAVPRAMYTGTNYPTMLPSSAIPPEQNVLMANPPLDKADLDSTQTGRPGYDQLPSPLVVGGRRVTDTKTRSNNIRFHDCLFVGSIVSDTPGGYTQSRNKVQFTGATRFAQQHPDQPDSTFLNPEPGDQIEISKTSMMLPNYSVDLGTFNSPPSQNLLLKGAIIAGVLDARGNIDIDGALMLTFSPAFGQAPLIDVLGNPIGNPANFNTTIGYFGPNDGDSESLDPNTLPIVGGQRIVGWDTNGDGLADVNPDQPQPSGSSAVPFYGYGRIRIRFDPLMTLPDGVMLPMQFTVIDGTYQEGRQ
jgi:hypothetical protein